MPQLVREPPLNPRPLARPGNAPRTPPGCTRARVTSALNPSARARVAGSPSPDSACPCPPRRAATRPGLRVRRAEHRKAGLRRPEERQDRRLRRRAKGDRPLNPVVGGLVPGRAVQPHPHAVYHRPALIERRGVIAQTSPGRHALCLWTCTIAATTAREGGEASRPPSRRGPTEPAGGPSPRNSPRFKPLTAWSKCHRSGGTISHRTPCPHHVLHHPDPFVDRAPGQAFTHHRLPPLFDDGRSDRAGIAAPVPP